MKYLILMDSFKGCMSSYEAGRFAKEGLMKAGISDDDITVFPIADGGEGTVDAITYSREYYGRKYSNIKASINKISISVTGPLGEPVSAFYTIIRDEEKTDFEGGTISSSVTEEYLNSAIAVIDMATAAGLSLVPENQRNPLYTTTYGVGEMIKDALTRGCRSFIIGIGGSATNDGGVGMLSALGYEFLDKNGTPIRAGAIGLRDLDRIVSTHALPELSECEFKVACDVKNPLLGDMGCSRVFAPQKGAGVEDIILMDSWLKNYADLTEDELRADADSRYKFESKSGYNAKSHFKFDRNTEGAGAAGGLGYAFLMYLNGKLESGISIILDELQIPKIIKDYDYILTGEGRIDKQSVMGKVINGIADIVSVRNPNAKIAIFAGSEGEGADSVLKLDNVDNYHIITPEGMKPAEAMDTDIARQNMVNTVYNVFR